MPAALTRLDIVSATRTENGYTLKESMDNDKLRS